jgi:CDGSH-type Zn-finger protein
VEGERSASRSGDLAEDLLEIARQKGAVSVTTHARGPYLVRGSFSIRDDHGQVLAMSRSTVALCRCGRSRQKPLCDGSHKALRRLGTPGAAGAQTASCSPDFSRSEERPADHDAMT